MHKSTYKTEIHVGKNKVFSENKVPEEDLYDILTLNINDSELFPRAILFDAIQFGMTSCWCGVKGYGYKIARNTPDNSIVDYIFN